MFPWTHEGSHGFCMLCFTVKAYGWRGFGHYTQHILSSNTLVFFPMLSQIVFCVKAWTVAWGSMPGMLGSAGGTAEKHMASNHDFFLLSLSSQNCRSCEFRAPLQGFFKLHPAAVAPNGNSPSRRSATSTLLPATAPKPLGWAVAIPRAWRHCYFSKHIAGPCAIPVKTQTVS